MVSPRRPRGPTTDDAAVVSYGIYRDDVLVAIVPAPTDRLADEDPVLEVASFQILDPRQRWAAYHLGRLAYNEFGRNTRLWWWPL